MPDNKKNPQQDQEKTQERQKQGDRQDAYPGMDEEREQERDQVRDRDINPGKQSSGKQGVTAEEDFDQQNEDDRITQRNPQQGMATPKPERK